MPMKIDSVIARQRAVLRHPDGGVYEYVGAPGLRVVRPIT